MTSRSTASSVLSSRSSSFPAVSELNQLLLTFATFGVGFFMRPVGGLLIGVYADRAGRKPALVLTIAMMSLGSLSIALAPYLRDAWDRIAFDRALRPLAAGIVCRRRGRRVVGADD